MVGGKAERCPSHCQTLNEGLVRLYAAPPALLHFQAWLPNPSANHQDIQDTVLPTTFTLFLVHFTLSTSQSACLYSIMAISIFQFLLVLPATWTAWCVYGLAVNHKLSV